LLSVLLFGVIAFVGWRWWAGSQPESDGGTEITISDANTRGGNLTVSLRSEPRTFNRFVARDFPTEFVSVLTGAKLVRVNRATGDVEPRLAEKWSLAPDNLTYTLTLRDGLTWSDGTPFTSADVVFSFAAIYDAKVASILASSLKIKGEPLAISAPDAKTVVVKFPSTFGPGIAILDNVALAPKHKYEAALESGTFAKAMGADTPPADLVTIGPFKLTSYAPGQRLVFSRNERYYNKDVAGIQLPYLDQVTLEIVPDQNAELVRLQSGQIDMLQQQVRSEDLATLRPLVDQNQLRLIELGVSTDPDLFFFNLRDPYWAKDPRRDWITRKEFRHAISHAIDREAYANTVYLGAGVPIWGPVTPGNKQWFSPNVPRYGYSIERAKEILAGLGLTNRDQDEWLEDAKGTEARFSVLTYQGNTSLERGSAILRDELKQVGIAVDVVTMEQGALVQRMLQGQFESIMFFFTSTNLDPAMNPDLWLSSGSAHIWNIGQAKPATDWEKEIDDKMVTVMSSLDQAERHRVFNEIQQIFANNLPAIYFVAPRLYMATSTRVGGLSPSILRPQLLWDVDRITVQGGR
jgi:peptide/nickel transport system substrate-binding protein